MLEALPQHAPQRKADGVYSCANGLTRPVYKEDSKGKIREEDWKVNQKIWDKT